MRILVDRMRHMVTDPCDRETMRTAARLLGIKECWWHRDHYDVPKRLHVDLMSDPRVEVVEPRIILSLARKK